MDQYASSSLSASNLIGYRPFVLESRGLAQDGDFHIYVAYDAAIAAEPSVYLHPDPDVWYPTYVAAWANMHFMPSTLTLFAQPVPEPSGYAMLLAGAAVIAWTRRRARRAV